MEFQIRLSCGIDDSCIHSGFQFGRNVSVELVDTGFIFSRHNYFSSGRGDSCSVPLTIRMENAELKKYRNRCPEQQMEHNESRRKKILRTPDSRTS
jgi:hypothetical protein